MLGKDRIKLYCFLGFVVLLALLSRSDLLLSEIRVNTIASLIVFWHVCDRLFSQEDDE